MATDITKIVVVHPSMDADETEMEGQETSEKEDNPELKVDEQEDVDEGRDGEPADASQLSEADQALELSQTSDTDSKAKKPAKVYVQKYRKVWETLDAFRGWLQPYPNNRFFAWCMVCQNSLRARKKDLMMHSTSDKHQQNAALTERGERELASPMSWSPQIKARSKVQFQKSLLYRAELAGWLCEIPNNPSRGWCQYCACRLTPQLHFLQNHARTAKHQRNESERTPQPPPQTDVDGDRGEPKLEEEITPFASRHRQWYEREDEENYIPELSSGNDQKRVRRESDNSTSPLVESDYANRVTYSIGIGNRKVGFIGAGQISQAIAQGLLEQGLLLPSDVVVSAPTRRNLTQWRNWKCQTTHSNDDVMNEADIIFVAVKVGSLAGMISKLSPVSDGRSRLVISVVPGVSRERLLELLQQRVLPPETPKPGQETNAEGASGLHVVRAAPSRMMSVRQGFCAYCMGEDLPHALYLVLETMFSAVGSCVQVEESLMNAYSVMVSSGAAFTCAFIESMVQAGVNQSMPWDDALKAAATVVCGTSQLLLRSGAEPSALKKAIATPGGATIAALTALHRGGLDDAVVTALEVACDKTVDAGGRI